MKLIRALNDIIWPPGAMLLVEPEEYQVIMKEILGRSSEPFLTIRGAEGTELEICDNVVYDHAAYKRAGEVMNERLRPRGVQIEAYKCESCEHQILLVTKSPKAQITCDVCQGRMVRTTT